MTCRLVVLRAYKHVISVQNSTLNFQAVAQKMAKELYSLKPPIFEDFKVFQGH